MMVQIKVENWQTEPTTITAILYPSLFFIAILVLQPATNNNQLTIETSTNLDLIHMFLDNIA